MDCESDGMRQEFRVDKLHEPLSHYTDAVRWGDLLFVSGVSPLLSDMSLVSDHISEQTEKVFENMGLVLAAAGADFSNIVKLTTYVLDVDDRLTINEIRKRIFGPTKPASTFIGIKQFTIPGMKIEVEAIVGLKRLPS